ncbi:adenylyl-sulfate kinase [Candidatus Bathyarchaeota archaeon]|nr:adenylyl-sulfate kinase [Candidatus Bathyarchaeota archaeon]
MRVNGWAIWITGLPGSGKSIVARTLKQRFSKEGIRSQIISSDQLRRILTPDPVYSEDERDMVYQTLTYIVEVLIRNGVNVIIDATGNKRKYRDDCRAKIKRFFEVYLRCPLETCIERESSREETHMAPKDIYAKAQTNEHSTVPGLGGPYEAPKTPEVLVDSNILSPEEISKIIVEYVQKPRL